MGICANCGAALDPAWKFCIRCGAPVRRLVIESIPAAIRPEPETAKPQRNRSTLIGIVVAIVGFALIVVVATLVFSSHG